MPLKRGSEALKQKLKAKNDTRAQNIDERKKSSALQYEVIERHHTSATEVSSEPDLLSSWYRRPQVKTG
jgi:hypothetical protein